MRTIASFVALFMTGCLLVPPASRVYRPETRELAIPQDLTEADVVAKMGKPASVSAKLDGGKLLVYEQTTTQTSPTTTTPVTAAPCRSMNYAGKRGQTGCEPAYVPGDGETIARKAVTVYDIAPDGKVQRATITE